MSRKPARASLGQALIELAAGLLVFLPLVLLAIDCSVIMIAVSSNEAACRDAARAASSGPPGLAVTGPAHTLTAGARPYKRALSVIKDLYAAAGFLKISENLKVTELLRSPLPQAPEGGPYIGEISVETTAEVYPPFLIRVFSENGCFQFKSTQKYPFTYVQPASSGY
ncbi:MAG: hypothetical protein K2X27_08925 [Candidatus Obscuribacterales bacterium]|nr:hypothetical protein [Candidatus Obscuribacterales bacterium]